MVYTCKSRVPPTSNPYSANSAYRPRMSPTECEPMSASAPGSSKVKQRKKPMRSNQVWLDEDNCPNCLPDFKGEMGKEAEREGRLLSNISSLSMLVLLL